MASPANRKFPLQPAEIDFTIDAGAMLTEGMQYLDGLAMVDIAVRNGLGLPQQQRLVPLRYHYDEAKLAMWVAARAQEVNAPAMRTRLVSSSTVAAAVAGSERGAAHAGGGGRNRSGGRDGGRRHAGPGAALHHGLSLEPRRKRHSG